MLNEPLHLKKTCYLWFIDYVVVHMRYLRCGDIWLGEMGERLEKVLRREKKRKKSGFVWFCKNNWIYFVG